MTAKEMFEALGYEQTRNNNDFIEYKNDSYGKGNYTYVRFIHVWKEYEAGYYDNGFEIIGIATMITIKEHEAITQQIKELGWS